MDFNKLATAKCQVTLSNKAQAYIDNSDTRPPKRRNVNDGDAIGDGHNDIPAERAPKKGRLSQNNGAGATRNLHVSSSGNDTPVGTPKTGRSTQENGADLSLSRQTSIPSIPASMAGSFSSRASLGSVGNTPARTDGPSDGDVALMGESESEEVIEVCDGDGERAASSKETPHEELGKYS